MNFNWHSDLEGRHAYLSASKSHWSNYDDEKFDATYRTALAAMLGTQLHAFGAQAIKLGIKLPRSPKTLNQYVNDAIGFRMTPEQVLYYSDNCFGTADAISFRHNFLRIHDLKTGVTATSMRQLEIYAAMFCLEYGIKPGAIAIELRIYQSDDVKILVPEVDDILQIMNTIIQFDTRIDELKAEALL